MALQFLRKNINLKILSLILALLLWSYVNFTQNPSSEVFVKIDVTNIEPINLATDLFVSEVPDKVNLNVKCSPRVLGSIKADKFKVYIDLWGAHEGPNTVKVNVVPPVGVEIIDIVPQKITVRITQKKK